MKPPITAPPTAVDTILERFERLGLTPLTLFKEHDWDDHIQASFQAARAHLRSALDGENATSGNKSYTQSASGMFTLFSFFLSLLKC